MVEGAKVTRKRKNRFGHFPFLCYQRNAAEGSIEERLGGAAGHRTLLAPNSRCSIITPGGFRARRGDRAERKRGPLGSRRALNRATRGQRDDRITEIYGGVEASGVKHTRPRNARLNHGGRVFFSSPSPREIISKSRATLGLSRGKNWLFRVRCFA